MELVKKVVNLLVENRIDFIVKNNNIQTSSLFAIMPGNVNIGFDFRAKYQIEEIFIYEDEPELIHIQNAHIGIKSRCSFEELSMLTPFKVTE